MKLYELTYLISPEISEQDLKSVSEKIKTLIQKEGGLFDKSIGPVKKKLSYPIKKKTDARLQVLNFYLEPEKIKNFKKEVEPEKNILRFIIIAKKAAKAEKAKRRKIQIQKPPISSLEKGPEKIKEEKVELEKIDKKLEEILDEI